MLNLHHNQTLDQLQMQHHILLITYILIYIIDFKLFIND